MGGGCLTLGRRDERPHPGPITLQDDKPVFFRCRLPIALDQVEPELLGDVSPTSAAASIPSVPKNISISPTTQKAIFEVLEEARRVVRDLLHKRKPELKDEQVRANIFFPRYDNKGKYVLKIRPGLHINMNRAEELEITLKEEQGLTGRVFVTGDPRVAQRLSTEPTGWDALYHITPALAAIIHPELKWIISMPLKWNNSQTIGVLNFDGLSHQFDVDALYECSRNVTKLALAITGLVMDH